MKLKPFLYPIYHPPVEGLWKEDSPALNEYQSLARPKTDSRDDNLADKISLLQGTPGAGKTYFIGMVAVYSLPGNREFLVVADPWMLDPVCIADIKSSLSTSPFPTREALSYTP